MRYPKTGDNRHTPFTYRNPDQIERTGLSGWLNTDTMEVVLCSRLEHLGLIERSGETGFDGKPLNDSLEPIDGKKLYDLQSEGGPRGSGRTEVRQWCAEQGWVHFVTNEEGTSLFFMCVSVEQEKICKRFAREAHLKSLFKARGYYANSTKDLD